MEMNDPRNKMRENAKKVDPNSILPRGAVYEHEGQPGTHSIVLEDQPDYNKAKVVGEQVTRDWEYVTVSRPVEMHEKILEVPTKRTIQTLVPNIQVREVVKTIPKEEIEYDNKIIPIHHKQVIDKYVEVPVTTGVETKYVPKVEIQERTVKVSKPEVKWIENVVERPQVKEVVRYIESDRNVETVIRYVPKKNEYILKDIPDVNEPMDVTSGNVKCSRDINGEAHQDAYPSINYVNLAQTDNLKFPSNSVLPSPRLDRIEQLFIPRVEQTVEIEKKIPVTVDVSVPFMVPKPVKIPVEVPVLRFRDHFVPVPVRRHIIPRITFTDEVFEVECVREKPVLVIEDHFKPIPVDVNIKLFEKDIKVNPIDPATISQSDFHALWMRVNADLLEDWRESHRDIGIIDTKIYGDKKEPHHDIKHKTNADTSANLEPSDVGETSELNKSRKDTSSNELGSVSSQDGVHDPASPLEFGPLPLHPGHPLMMTYLQNQWILNPSTLTHNMYTPELFRLHASSLDSILHPQPHQVNITEEQSLQFGPLPADVLINPWMGIHANKEFLTKTAQQQTAPISDIGMDNKNTNFFSANMNQNANNES